MKSKDNYIITSIKKIYNRDYLYTAVSEKPNAMQIMFDEKNKFELYDEINFNLDVKKENKNIVKEGKIDRKECNNIIDIIISEDIKRINSIAPSSKNEELNKVTEKLLPELKNVVIRIIKNISTGAPIIVRFHNDSDGCSGALALYKSLNNFMNRKNISSAHIFWRINKSIAYSVDALYEDKIIINQYNSSEKPLLLIIDFGTAEESIDALNLKKDFDIIMLDHHPIFDNFQTKNIDVYINPWNYNGDSNYTAGFLAGVAAELISDVNVKPLMDASLIGDHSIYCDLKNKNAEKISVVLDYITGKKQNFSIENTLKIIDDTDILEKNFKHSTQLFESAISSALKHIKRYKGAEGILIFVLDFNHVERIEDDFPLPGRFSSKLHDKIEELNGPNLTIVHYGSFISLRLSNALVDKFNMLKKLDEFKITNEYVYSAGGHNAAASIKINKEYIKPVLNSLLNFFGVNNKI